MSPIDARRAVKVLDDLKATKAFAPFDDTPIYMILARSQVEKVPAIKDALIIQMTPGEQDALLHFLLEGQEAELASLGIEAA